MTELQVIVLTITGAAYWKRDTILYILAAIVCIFYGLSYTETSMIFGILVIFFGIWTFIKGVLNWRGV